MMNKLRSIAWLVGALSMAVWLHSCGGSSSPTSPSSSSAPTTPTITITDTGVSPQQVQISAGGQVLIVNSGANLHEIQSDLNPAHDNCPPMNQPGLLPSGASGLTGAFTLAGTCGFHDHQNPTLDSFQGFVLVDVDEPDPTSAPAY